MVETARPTAAALATARPLATDGDTDTDTPICLPTDRPSEGEAVADPLRALPVCLVSETALAAEAVRVSSRVFAAVRTGLAVTVAAAVLETDLATETAAVTGAVRTLAGCLLSAGMRDAAAERETATDLLSVIPAEAAAPRAMLMLRDSPAAVAVVALRVLDTARASAGDAVMLAVSTLPVSRICPSVGLVVSPALRLR